MHFSVEMLSENIGLKTESKSNSKFVFFEIRCVYLEFLWCVYFVGYFRKNILILINNSCHPFQLLF